MNSWNDAVLDYVRAPLSLVYLLTYLSKIVKRYVSHRSSEIKEIQKSSIAIWNLPDFNDEFSLWILTRIFLFTNLVLLSALSFVSDVSKWQIQRQSKLAFHTYTNNYLHSNLHSRVFLFEWNRWQAKMKVHIGILLFFFICGGIESLLLESAIVGGIAGLLGYSFDIHCKWQECCNDKYIIGHTSSKYTVELL